LLHIQIEPIELGLDRPRLLPLLGDHAVATQGREQMHQRCPVLVHQPANRFRAAATRQMLSQIPRHRIFIEPLQGEPLMPHPVSEVRDADEVDAPGACRVPPGPEIRPVFGCMRFQGALLQPSACMRL